jgi:hypothetical protein
LPDDASPLCLADCFDNPRRIRPAEFRINGRHASYPLPRHRITNSRLDFADAFCSDRLEQGWCDEVATRTRRVDRADRGFCEIRNRSTVRGCGFAGYDEIRSDRKSVLSRRCAPDFAKGHAKSRAGSCAEPPAESIAEIPAGRGFVFASASGSGGTNRRIAATRTAADQGFRPGRGQAGNSKPGRGLSGTSASLSTRA